MLLHVYSLGVSLLADRLACNQATQSELLITMKIDGAYQCTHTFLQNSLCLAQSSLAQSVDNCRCLADQLPNTFGTIFYVTLSSQTLI